MSLSTLRYQTDGHIDHWLVAGPEKLPLDSEMDGSNPMQQPESTAEPQIQRPIAEGKELSDSTDALKWRVVDCREDHLVDLSTEVKEPSRLRSWAYIDLMSPEPQKAELVLTANGPADLWLNGRHILRRESSGEQGHDEATYTCDLQEGDNEILVRFEQMGVGNLPHFMGLRVAGLTAETELTLPTTIEQVQRRQVLTSVFDHAYLDRQVYGMKDRITLHWPDSMQEAAAIAIRLQDPKERIYVEARPSVSSSDAVDLAWGGEVPDGPIDVLLMPQFHEYYVENRRVRRHIRLNIVRQPYADLPYGTYEQRRREALDYAAAREDDVYGQIARMELGRWTDLDMDSIKAALEVINKDGMDSARHLLALLGALYRYEEDPHFPKELSKEIRDALLGFEYDADQAVRAYGTAHDLAESTDIIRHACETLAGGLLSDETFVRSGQSGVWHRGHGKELTLSWLTLHGTHGFRLWDSPAAFADMLFALVHLVDLSEDERVQELSAVLMDKIFFSLALNSFRGSFGATSGAAETGTTIDGRLSATAGISRLMWGMGVYNPKTAGTVALACSREYELPSLISEIARFLPEGIWSRERHQVPASAETSEEEWEVNKVSYKTAAYQLASAQDYFPGQNGRVETIWRATMGPDAVVFVNHPTCMSEHDARRPNFWRGNGVLPRVAQWHDFLIALHHLPETDPLGFTHAYFPTYAFDAYEITDKWAFARTGEAYLALMASQGLELIREGPSALRELRSMGRENVWLCQMGLRSDFGTLADFQDAILALDIDCEGLSVEATTLAGQKVSFGWTGPFLVDGEAQALSGFKHYESPFCVAELPAEEMDIRFGEWLMRLHFAE